LARELEQNEKVLPIHPSSIPVDVLLAVGSLWQGCHQHFYFGDLEGKKYLKVPYCRQFPAGCKNSMIIIIIFTFLCNL
jgi:hypothetical protein